MYNKDEIYLYENKQSILSIYISSLEMRNK